MKTFSIDNLNSHEILNTYLQAIDVNIISSITDTKGKIIHANDKFCEVSKYKRDELIGKNHSVVNSGNHSKEFFEDLWKTISSNKTWHGEIKNMAKDGTCYWVDTVIIPLKTEKISGYLSLRTLITERKELEQRKEEYIKSLEDMLILTSHNTRRPIVSILGLLNIKIEKLSAEELKKLLAYLKESAEELEKFTREFTIHLDALKKKWM